MASDPFSWDDLRLVLAISSARGLERAAERLGVNGSTVFRRLRQIEARLGLSLFDRHRSGYEPTPAGREMAALAERVDADVFALSRRLAGQSPSLEGEIRITTPDTLLVNLLTPILARFRRRHPAIRLDIVISNEALNLARRDADVAVRATDEPPETLVGRRISSVAWAIYGPVGRLAEAGDGAAWGADQDWVALGEGLETVAAARVVRQLAGPDRIVYRVSTVLGLADAVEAGIGIGRPALPGRRRAAGPREARAARP